MIRKTIIVVLTLAAIAIAVVWIDSYLAESKANQWWARVAVIRRLLPRQFAAITLSTQRGTLGLQIHYRSVAPSGTDWSVPGIKRRQDYPTSRPFNSFVNYYVRLWLPFSALVVYPVIAVLRGPLRRWRRRRRGLCLECGYDLRGSTDRCPECGTRIESGRQGDSSDSSGE